jgi:hypothetical protein
VSSLPGSVGPPRFGHVLEPTAVVAEDVLAEAAPPSAPSLMVMVEEAVTVESIGRTRSCCLVRHPLGRDIREHTVARVLCRSWTRLARDGQVEVPIVLDVHELKIHENWTGVSASGGQ